MADPNPFVFGASSAGGMEPPNPFLSGEDHSAAANPFITGGMAAPIMHQAQPHYGAYATPPPISDASNPFASFGAPTAPVQNSLFGVNSTYYHQTIQQQQPQQQIHNTPFGQYGQPMGNDFSQQNVVSSIQSPPVPQRTPNVSQANPFAAAIDTVTLDETSAPKLPATAGLKEIFVTDGSSNQTPLADNATSGTPEVAPSLQEEIPPPPPISLIQQDIKTLPEQSADESLPPPPAQESITDDEPLPPPPVVSEDIHEISNKERFDSDLVKTLDGVQIDTEKVPAICVDDALTNDISEPSTKDITEQQSQKEQEGGFSGIFTNELLDTGETIKATVSITDLDQDKTENLKQVASTNENNISDQKASDSKRHMSDAGDDITVKANSIGASLFGGIDEPVAVCTEDTGIEYPDSVTANKVTDYNQKPESSNSSSEGATPQKPAMSTGDAIFADLPTMPEVTSTGAAIFGMSEESAKDTTGAAIFGVVAPRSVRPQLGQMSGWDDAFDKKFETAITQEIGDAFDPFGGSGGMAADAFISGNFPAAPNSTPAISRKEDAFGQAPMTDDLNNPFLLLDGQKPMDADRVEESCDGPLYDDDTSKPLQPFPRLKYDGDGWEMFIRHPPKKKLTAQRYIYYRDIFCHYWSLIIL